MCLLPDPTKTNMINSRCGFLILLLILVIGCNSDRSQSEESTENTGMGLVEEEIHRFTEKQNKDSLLLGLTEEILGIIKENSYRKLANYIHPESGLRLSPYGYIDTVQHVHFTRQGLLRQAEQDASILWGSYDGTGKDIRFSLDGYFDRFVYDEDFLNAEQVSINEVLGKGNSLINIAVIYPGADFTESYFSGFEEKYGGMDWRSLRLVFQRQDDKVYLVAIVHDEWTV